MVETKMLISSFISDADKGETLFSADIKYLCLASPMTTPEYMKVTSELLNSFFRFSGVTLQKVLG